MIMAEEKNEKMPARAKKQKKEEPRQEQKPVPAAKPAETPEVAKQAKPQEKPGPKHEAKPEAPPKPRPAKRQKKPKGKAVRVEIARGKRKTSIARASVREGGGRIRVNSILTSTIQNRYARELIEEPLAFAGPEGSKVDITVSTRGGGEMGQAQAARTAIARALAQYFGEGLKKAYDEADKYFLCEDPRRVEPKKYKGRKARARFQKSYR